MNKNTKTIIDPFCQCGYRQSAHQGNDQRCPLRGGYENIDGKVVYRPEGNPGVTFLHSPGFNQ